MDPYQKCLALCFWFYSLSFLKDQMMSILTVHWESWSADFFLFSMPFVRNVSQFQTGIELLCTRVCFGCYTDHWNLINPVPPMQAQKWFKHFLLIEIMLFILYQLENYLLDVQRIFILTIVITRIRKWSNWFAASCKWC